MTSTDPSPVVDVTDAVVSAAVDIAPDAIVIADAQGMIFLANRQMEQVFGYGEGELIGRPIEDLMPGRFRQAHQSHRTDFEGHPKTRPMGAGLELLALRRDGTEFHVEVSLSPVASEGGSAVIASVRDVSERVVEEAVRVAEVHARVEADHRSSEIEHDRQEGWLRGLSEIQSAILSDRPTDEVLALTCRFACDLSGANMAAVGQPDEDWEMIELVSVLSEADLAIGTTFAIDGTIREALETMRAVVRHDLPFDAPESVVGLVGSSIVAPLIAGGEVIGVLLLGKPVGADLFEPAVVAYVESFAYQAARALDKARIHRDRQRLAILEDRERIGRDLHDLVIQRLFVAGMGLEAIIEVAPVGQVRDRVESTVRELDETIDEIRTTIFDLHAAPTATVATRILDTVVAHVEQLGFDPVVGFSGQLDSISPRLVRHLLPVLNEAISNVARHANATAVSVRIDLADGNLVLMVSDDGDGIGQEVVRGNGLENLESRAHRLGGSCTLERGPSGGTVLTWKAPL